MRALSLACRRAGERERERERGSRSFPKDTLWCFKRREQRWRAPRARPGVQRTGIDVGLESVASLRSGRWRVFWKACGDHSSKCRRGQRAPARGGGLARRRRRAARATRAPTRERHASPRKKRISRKKRERHAPFFSYLRFLSLSLVAALSLSLVALFVGVAETPLSRERERERERERDARIEEMRSLARPETGS